MLLSSVGILFLALIGAVTSQEQQQQQQQPSTTNGTLLNHIATQYGSSFQNAGGKVLTSFVNAYVIFYGDWSSTNGTTDQKTFLGFVDSISTTPWFSILKEYTDGNSNSVSGSLNLAAALHDSGSAGLNLTDHNTHKNIILNAVKSGYLSENNQLDSDGVYIIILGPGVHDSEFCSSNCGYNSYSDQFQYIFIGYPGACPENCIPPMIQKKSPNNSPSMDSIITLFSHEIQDVLTDPRMDAWSIRNGNDVVELGDFCSGRDTSSEQWFGNIQTTSEGASYNLESNGGKYLVQTIYSKEKKTCLLSK